LRIISPYGDSGCAAVQAAKSNSYSYFGAPQHKALPQRQSFVLDNVSEKVGNFAKITDLKSLNFYFKLQKRASCN